MSRLSSSHRLFTSGLAVGVALTLAFLMGSLLTPVSAEDLPGLTNPHSPLVFPPLFRAEVSAAPIWVTLSSGHVSGADIEHSWDLENVFKLAHRNVYVDFMARLQTGRFSFRAYYEPRDFSGEKHFQDDPNAPMTTARLSWPGVRVGGDIDIAQWQLSRIGVDIDYDLLSATFTESSETEGGFKMTGGGPLTIGIHGVYNPTATCWGISPMIQFRARWPVSGVELTELMIAAGLRTPETVLGSMAWKSGYRHTLIEFGQNRRTLDVTLDGWFSELAYYY
jgi:hypothetical protein